MTGGPYYYRTVWTTASPPTANHATSRTEIIHVVIAFLVLTGDLTIILSGRGFLQGGSLAGPIPVFYVLLALAAALTGFIAHEMAHKWIARRLGYWAEFRMWPMGLILSILTSLAGFLFAAPGATMVSGLDPRDSVGWGRVGLAGPASNLVFAAGFYLASIATFSRGAGVYAPLLFLAMINTLFATFNLLPIGPLDGAKVLRWGVGRWAGSFLVAAAFFGVAYAALYGYGSPFLAW